MANLNPKERQRLSQLHEQIRSGNFSETEVAALLVLMHERAPKGPVVEIAHGISHSERNSGEFMRRIKANRDMLNNLGKKNGVIDGRPLFRAEAFGQDLHQALESVSATPFEPHINEAIFLCGLSLIQAGSIRRDDDTGQISFVAATDEFRLHATTPITYQGKVTHVTFAVAAAPNRAVPICNPRASIDSVGPVSVTVRNHVAVVDGFKPFEIQIERAAHIDRIDLMNLMLAEPKLGRTEEGLMYYPDNMPPLPLRYDGQRLIVPGLPAFFLMGSEYEAALKRISRRLKACVHDDADAHWFLEGLNEIKDGFHCHWVGRGSPSCTRPR